MVQLRNFSNYGKTLYISKRWFFMQIECFLPYWWKLRYLINRVCSCTLRDWRKPVRRYQVLSFAREFFVGEKSSLFSIIRYFLLQLFKNQINPVLHNQSLRRQSVGKVTKIICDIFLKVPHAKLIYWGLTSVQLLVIQ